MRYSRDGVLKMIIKKVLPGDGSTFFMREISWRPVSLFCCMAQVYGLTILPLWEIFRYEKMCGIMPYMNR